MSRRRLQDQRDPYRRPDWFDSHPTAVVEREAHFRTREGVEVDLLLETRDGGLVGVEVKAAATVRSGDFAGRRRPAEQVGDRFRRGVVLYSGDEAVGYGPGLTALPVHSLCTMRGSPA